jgi:sorting nexin-1/2
VQLIELWETYLLQLDSDEDGPPLMPAGIVADPDPKSDAQLRREAATAQLDAENGENGSNEEDERRLSGTTAQDSETGFGRDSEDTVQGDLRGSEESEA